MNKLVATLILLGFTFGSVAEHHEEVILPAKISAEDAAGEIFKREDMIRTEHKDGHVTLDVTSLLSSDKKFSSGMYSSGKTRSEITGAYGVDEFMFFLSGGVTLTSSDGTVTTINAGEGVTIPKEWTGIWDTDGYTKIWVIYSADGSYFK
tara:strand:- start:1937 stop:2386 length:450 start_codon:yes stop_codon:yes gene_type:complete